MSETGRADSARQILLTAQELNPKDPVLYYYMGKVFIKMQDTTSAITQMKKALELYFPDK
jgi:predicted Zn-dependent protease